MNEGNKLSDRVKSRLFNYKFKKAHQYMAEDMASGTQYDYEDIELVNSLNMMFGDIGGFEGPMSNIIANALENVGANMSQ